MKKADDKKRKAPFSYRPPEALREEFERRVARSGLSVSAFITKHCLGEMLPSQVRHKSSVKKDAARQLADLAEIKSLLVAFKDTHPDSAEFDRLFARINEELQLNRTLIMRMLGRKS